MNRELLQEIDDYLNEKLDRCARIAKRKYRVWPSAYASGAAVKCRKGKIWRGVKEEIEEEIELVDEDKFKKTTGRPFTLADLGIDLEKMAEETLPNGAPRYYINMFGIEKVGINPVPLSKTATGKGATGYTSTPIGVYAYPLNKTYYDLLVTGELPYRSSSPHINILEAADPSNMLYLVDEDSYLTYCEIKMRVIGYSRTLMNKGLPQDECFYYVKDVFDLEGFPYSEDLPGKNKVVQFAKQLLADGITSVYDPGRGLIHLGERTQIVFLSPKAYKLVHRINNKEVVGSRKKEIINYIEKNVGGGNVFEKLLQMLLNKEMKKFSDAVAPFLKVKQPDKSSKKDVEAYVRAVFDFFTKFNMFAFKRMEKIPEDEREELGFDSDLLEFLKRLPNLLIHTVWNINSLPPYTSSERTNPMIQQFLLSYPTDDVRFALLKTTGFIPFNQEQAAEIFNKLEEPEAIDFVLTDFFNPLKLIKSYSGQKPEYSTFFRLIKNKIFEESPIGIRILFLRKLFTAPKEIQQQAAITSAEIKKYYINSGNEAAASIGKSYLEKMPFFKRLGLFEEIDGFLNETKKRNYKPDFSREKAESASDTLQRLATDDQKLRNKFDDLIKSRGGWSSELVDEFVAEKGTSKNDVFGDKESGRQDEFRDLFSKLSDTDYVGFSDKDWDNFFLLAQHFDSDRKLQKQAQKVLLKYRGEEDSNYHYITDRISCAETGTQKYGTQNGCNKDENLEEKKKRKYKPDFSREEDEGLHGWFARNQGKGWVNCRTGGPCGRESADKGGKYPACRPTMAQCKSAGKGPLRRKKSSKQISWTGDKKND